MENEKKTRSRRRGAAVALAVTGVAALSVASAAQLNLNGAGASVAQAGTAQVEGACQTSTIDVSFAVSGGTVGSLVTGPGFGFASGTDNLVLDEVDAACAGRTMRVALGDAAGDQVGTTHEVASVAAGVQSIPMSTFAADTSGATQVSVTLFG